MNKITDIEETFTSEEAENGKIIQNEFSRIFPEPGNTPSGNPYDGQQRMLDFMTKAD